MKNSCSICREVDDHENVQCERMGGSCMSKSVAQSDVAIIRRMRKLFRGWWGDIIEA